MALGKLFNLFALSSFAVLVCNLGVATPVNALATGGHHIAKVKRAHGHEGVSKRRRDNSSQRCRQRSTSASATPTPTSSSTSWSTPQATSTPEPSSSTSEAAPSQSSSAASTPTISSGNGKVGLAWANGNDDSLRNFVTGNTHYLYTWTEQCPSLASALGLECMPMLWGGSQDKLDAFKNTVTAGYAKIAMGFNEVNEAGQANLDVDTAVSLWYQYLEPLADEGYSLIAPVTSSNPNGYDWMQEFMSKCTTCRIAAMPVHYYGTNAQDMITYIEKWHNGFQLPIWVTEYACQNFNTAYENNGQQCSDSQVWEFHKTIAQYAESNDYIVAIFPFGLMHDMQGVNTLNQLMSSDGSPSALGSTIINLSFQ